MEALDHLAMSAAVYPTLLRRVRARALGEWSVGRVVATVADGYLLPTNVDQDPPVDGLAPRTQQARVLEALREGWSVARLLDELQSRPRLRLPGHAVT